MDHGSLPIRTAYGSAVGLCMALAAAATQRQESTRQQSRTRRRSRFAAGARPDAGSGAAGEGGGAGEGADSDGGSDSGGEGAQRGGVAPPSRAGASSAGAFISGGAESVFGLRLGLRRQTRVSFTFLRAVDWLAELSDATQGAAMRGSAGGVVLASPWGSYDYP